MTRNNIDILYRHQLILCHFLDLWNNGLQALLGINDLNNYRKVFTQAQDACGMENAVDAIPFKTPKNSSAGNSFASSYNHTAISVRIFFVCAIFSKSKSIFSRPIELVLIPVITLHELFIE